ncbi:glycosyltransferase, partial [Streptomyces sp. SID11385]|nr:glycosyltransferase [Streptomyces sp. SID11385]
LVTLTDVDTAPDALSVAALAPHSRFAAAVAALPQGLLTSCTTTGSHP